MWILFLSTIFIYGFSGCSVMSINTNTVTNVNGSKSLKTGDGTDDSSDRVVGGRTISIDLVPHQVYIRTLAVCNGRRCTYFTCGGSIIHPRFILTAAHCLFRDNPMAGVNPNKMDIRIRGPNSKVRVGSSFSAAGGTVLQGRRNVVHWRYHDPAFEMDLALIMLNESITWGPKGRAPQMIQIPKSEDEFQRKWDKGPCWVSGWGDSAPLDYWQRSMNPEANQVERQRLHKPRTEPELHQAEVDIVDRPDCKKMLRDFSDPSHKDPGAEAAINGEAATLTQYYVCAYGRGQRDVCQGDSGGPLTCFEKKSGKQMLYGTVQAGYGCAAARVPGFYMNAPQLRVWIKQFVKKYLPAGEDPTPFN